MLISIFFKIGGVNAEINKDYLLAQMQETPFGNLNTSLEYQPEFDLSDPSPDINILTIDLQVLENDLEIEERRPEFAWIMPDLDQYLDDELETVVYLSDDEIVSRGDLEKTLNGKHESHEINRELDCGSYLWKVEIRRKFTDEIIAESRVESFNIINCNEEVMEIPDVSVSEPLVLLFDVGYGTRNAISFLIGFFWAFIIGVILIISSNSKLNKTSQNI